MRQFIFDRSKFQNLVHYIIWKCPDPAKLGSTKLHKILWNAETRHFLMKGEPIAGARYIKREWGPMAEKLLIARDELVREGAIKFWRDRKFAGDYSKDIYEALRPPPKGILTESEREAVDYWVKEICLKHTAKTISEETHGLAWETARMNEEMPIQSILIERIREPKEDELERARKKAQERGLL